MRLECMIINKDIINIQVSFIHFIYIQTDSKDFVIYVDNMLYFKSFE